VSHRTREPDWWRATLLGVGLLVALTAIKLAVPAIGRPTPFLAYFVAVLGAAWLGGLTAGLILTVLVAITGTGWAIAGTPDAEWDTIALQLGVFCMDGAAVSWLAARARDSARDALAQRQAVLDALEIGVTMLDAKGQLIYANAAAARMTGFASVEELLAMPLPDVQRRFELLDVEGRPIPRERMPHHVALTGGEPEEVLAQLQLRGREPRFVVGSAHAVRDDAGALRFVVGSFRDVTAARRDASRREFVARATEALSSSIDYETTLATVARLAVPQMADWCAVDMLENGEIRRVVSAHVDPSKVRLVDEYQRRYPYDPESSTGVPAILSTGKAELVPVIPTAGIEAAAADEEHLRFLRELQLHSYIGVPLVAEGRPCGVITLMMAESSRTYDEDDLAFATALADRASVAIENARLFDAAKRAREEAVLASRAKDDFLAMLGHELRNPLAPITSALEVIKECPTTGSDARAREVIERQVRVMVRLVDDLLDVSRIVHGRVGLVMDRVDMAKVIDVRPGLAVRGDVQRLVQVFANLFTNAAKYSEPGGHITVHGAREDDEVVIRVRDTGVGISPQMLPWIFDVFVQQPQAIDRAQGGLGLGLAIVKGIVELHGGRVTAHSEGLGRGTELVVRLPANRAVTAAVAAATPARPPGKARPGMRVLLVDDNVDALEMLAEVLRRVECETFTASDAGSALAIAREARPTIALLDIGLPVIDGYELGRRLREIEGLEDLVLVALTGYGQPSDHERSAAAGFAAHLVKPVAFAELSAVLEEAQARGPGPSEDHQ
jgi:signal transduction histidine kinase/PAS domain-containing protein/ActR/RegA family two-component response regulator